MQHFYDAFIHDALPFGFLFLKNPITLKFVGSA